MPKKFAINLLLLFTTFIFCLAILEIAVRIFFPQEILWKAEDKILGYRYQPNLSGRYSRKGEFETFIQINDLGFRDDNHQVEKLAGSCRIAVVGDSFVAGFEVDLASHFSKLLEQRQNSAPVGDCQRFEVLNFGVSGWGTDQEYLAFKNIGLDFRPDVVVLGLVTINDIRNNSAVLDKLYQQLNKAPNPKNYFILKDGELVQTNTLAEENFFGQKKTKIKRFLKNHFQVIAFIADRVRKVKFLAKPLVKMGVVSDMFVELKPDYIPLDYQIYRQDYDDDWQVAWAVTKKLILEFRQLAAQNSADFILMLIPNQEQVDDGRWNKILETYPAMKEGEWEREKPQLALSEFCWQEQLNCLDLLPIFKEAISKDPTIKFYFKFDGHFNETGQQKVSEALDEYIREMKTATTTEAENKNPTANQLN